MHQDLIDFYNAYFRLLTQNEGDFIWRVITKLDEDKRVSGREKERAREIMSKYK